MRLYKHPKHKHYACDINGVIYSRYKPYDMLTRSNGTFIGHKLSNKFYKINPYVRKDGYVNFFIRGKRIWCHRFVFECITDKTYEWYDNKSKNKLVINHINSVKNDNRFTNLELVTTRLNIQKSKHLLNKKSNLPRGVRYHSNRSKNRIKRFSVSICINGKVKSFGYYLTKDEAYKKSKEVYKKYFNEII